MTSEHKAYAGLYTCSRIILPYINI